MPIVKVGIINVTGYIGIDLVRILYGHPEVKIVSVTGRSAVGQKLGDVVPHLSDIDLQISADLADVDVAFSALPHGENAKAVVSALNKGIRVIDIGADFRLKDPAEFQQWYKQVHPAPSYLDEAVYGLTELNRNGISNARLVANPGCYPTGAILALAPAIKEDLIDLDIIIDSKSGASGAGRTLTLNTHFAELNENLSAYSLDGHRHLPEIVQELKKILSKGSVEVTFLPHLVPMTRGILSSCYARLHPGKIDAGEKGIAEIRRIYQDFYEGETFIKVVSVPPQTKQTWGSNECLIYPTVDVRTGRLIVISCIDNLVKGGAGQAVQNMNVMLGFPETMGLKNLPIYP